MITFSQQAIEFFQRQSSTQDMKYWSIGLKKIGCSGYQYDVSWQSEPCGDVTLMDGWYVCVDRQWSHVIDHVKVDLQSDTLGQKKVVFENDMTSSWCGCGDSFMLSESV